MLLELRRPPFQQSWRRLGHRQLALWWLLSSRTHSLELSACSAVKLATLNGVPKSGPPPHTLCSTLVIMMLVTRTLGLLLPVPRSPKP